MRGLEKVFLDAAWETSKLMHDTNWDLGDIRISMFGRLSGTMHSAFLSTIFLDRYLKEESWWKKFLSKEALGEHYDTFMSSRKQAIGCYADQALTALYLGLASKTESSFRVLANTLKPDGFKADTSFKNIYEFLLKKTGHAEDKAIYDILRLVRNALLHTNGVCMPHNGKDVSVDYRERCYEFEAGKPFTGATWELATDLARDTLDSMLRVVRSRLISNYPLIPDPRKATSRASS